MLLSLLSFDSLGMVDSHDNGVVRQDVCFGQSDLAIDKACHSDIFVKGSCVLDIHVSCPLAWAISFSELSPHSVEIFCWKRAAQRTLFS